MLKADIKELNHLLGNVDIYLLDQILKARFDKKFNILDAGCGEGRNLIYFIRNDYQVWAIDKNKDSIQMLKYLVRSINKLYPIDRFIDGDVEKMPFEDHFFDAVISSAVLHFAESKDHFVSMLGEHVRVLKTGGIFFARMTTNIGIEHMIKPLDHGKYLLPDGSVRFLLDKEQLHDIIQKFGFDFVEPFKTVIVDNLRSMSTLVLKKL